MSKAKLSTWTSSMEPEFYDVKKDSECEETDVYYDTDSSCSMTDLYEEEESENEDGHTCAAVGACLIHKSSNDSELSTTIYPARRNEPLKKSQPPLWRWSKQARGISKSTYFKRRLSVKGSQDSTNSSASTICTFDNEK
jgi:hypothetical protein